MQTRCQGLWCARQGKEWNRLCFGETNAGLAHECAHVTLCRESILTRTTARKHYLLALWDHPQSRHAVLLFHLVQKLLSLAAIRATNAPNHNNSLQSSTEAIAIPSQQQHEVSPPCCDMASAHSWRYARLMELRGATSLSSMDAAMACRYSTRVNMEYENQTRKAQQLARIVLGPPN